MRTFAEFIITCLMPEPAGSQQQAGTKINSDELIHMQVQSSFVTEYTTC